MDSFLQVFGGITIGQVAIFIAALIFLGGILKAVWSYVSNKITKSNEKASEWKKIAEQVQQYPKWHEHSLKKQEEYASMFTKVFDSMGGIEKTLREMQLKNNRDYASTCRYRIIRFNDELLQKEIFHTKEHFDQILDDIDEYEDYCRQDPDYKNSKAIMAINHIRQVYQKCTNEGNFYKKEVGT